MSDVLFPKAIRVRAIGLLAVVSLIAACGGSTGEPSDPDSPTTTEASSPDEGTPDVAGEETLASFFGWDVDQDPAAAEAEWRDQEAERQELIRQCMAEQGFDYVPAQQAEGSFVVGTDEEEWARTRGFGVTTWFGEEAQIEESLDLEDPNQAIVDAMSDSEREAFYEALHGSQEDWDEHAVTEIDPETGEETQFFDGWGFGCEGEASEQVYGAMGQGNDLWNELGPQMESMYERVQADPRIVELNEDWSQCMAEAGYDYHSREDMYESVFQDFQERFDDLVGDVWSIDPFSGWSEDEITAFFEESTQDEIDAFFSEADELARSAVDDEALAALQQEEIDLAVANYECSQGLNEAYAEVSREYEAEFIAANRDVLEQIREAQNG